MRKSLGFLPLLVLCALALPAMAFGTPFASFGNAIDIGGDAGIQSPSSPGMQFSGLSDFTIEMWVKPRTYGSSTLYRQRGAGGTLQTWLLIRDTGEVELALDNFGLGWYGVVADRPLKLDRWTHVAAVKNGADLRIYLDGRLAASGIAGATQTSAGPCNAGITLGRDWIEGHQYQGLMDEVRLFSAAEDPATIAAWRFRGVDSQHPFAAQLRAYFRLDESSGTSLTDLAGGAGGIVVSSLPAAFVGSTVGREYRTRQGFPVSGHLPFYEGPAFGADASVTVQPANGSVSISDTAWGAFTYTPDAPFLGTDEFTYRYTDSNGDSKLATVTVEVLTPDTTPPETSASFVPSGEWVSVPEVMVRLTPSDDSDIAVTDYRLDGGSLLTYSTPFPVTAEGTTTVSFRSADVYGNVEDTKTATVLIDRTPPVTRCDALSSYVGTATVSFSAEDTGSGVAETMVIVDGMPASDPARVVLNTPGFHQILYLSYDAVLNFEDLREITVAVRDIVRVAGPTRYETAVEASKRAFPEGAGTVIVATGERYPDALAGCGLAGVYDAPILLTHKDFLPRCTAEEIGRLGSQRVVILGSTEAVSEDVETALRSLAGAVERIGGIDRYETAEMIASRMAAELGDEYDGRAFIATGENFADALAASPLATRGRWPILLVRSGEDLRPSTRSVMTSIGVTDPYMLGSEVVVSLSVASELRTMTRHDVPRLAGATRWETSGAIARFAVDEVGFEWDGLALATGDNYPDALVAGPLQAHAGAPLLLTHTDSLTPAGAEVLEEFASEIIRLVYVGGKPSLSDAADRDVQDALR